MDWHLVRLGTSFSIVLRVFSLRGGGVKWRELGLKSPPFQTCRSQSSGSSPKSAR
jgi:hypothetical protein